MANTLSSHNYDGRLSTAVFSLDGTVSAVSTTNNVVGQIVQYAVTNSDDLQIDINLQDATNGMTLDTQANVSTTDITANNINSGSGAWCRGILTVDTTTKDSGSGTITFTVYYIKM